MLSVKMAHLNLTLSIFTLNREKNKQTKSVEWNGITLFCLLLSALESASMIFDIVSKFTHSPTLTLHVHSLWFAVCLVTDSTTWAMWKVKFVLEEREKKPKQLFPIWSFSLGFQLAFGNSIANVKFIGLYSQHQWDK